MLDEGTGIQEVLVITVRHARHECRPPRIPKPLPALAALFPRKPYRPLEFHNIREIRDQQDSPAPFQRSRWSVPPVLVLGKKRVAKGGRRHFRKPPAAFGSCADPP